MKTRRVHPAKVFVRGFGFSEGLEWGLWLALTVYWIVELDLSITELALLGVVLELTVILSETPTGVVADVRSRKQSLLIGQVLMGASFAWTFAVENIWMLLASHALLGFGWTFRSGSDAAWITDELQGVDRGASSPRGEREITSDVEQLLLKRGRVGMLISLIVGPITIAVGWWQSVRVIGLVLSVAFGAVALWLAIAMSEDHFTRGAERGMGLRATLRTGVGVVRSQPRLRKLILVAALLFAAAELFGRIGYIHLLDSGGLRDLDGSGESLLVLGVLFFATAIAGLLINTAASRRLEGGHDIVRVGGVLLLVASVGGVLASTTSIFVLVGIGFLLQDSVQEAMYPVMEGWANRDAPKEVRATVHSLVGQTTSMSQIGGAIVLGALAEVTSVQVGLGAATALMVCAALVALRSSV